MKSKKITAVILMITMLVGVMPMQVFAEAQTPIKKVQVDVQNFPNSPREGEISPDVNVIWTKSTPPTEALTGAELGPFYQISLTDLTSKTTYLSERIEYTAAATMSVKLQDVKFGYDIIGKNPSGELYTLENGKPYKMEVIPKHYESRYDDKGEPYNLLITGSGPHEITQFITDFNTKMKDGDKGLEMTWEYIPGADYEVTYIAADRKTVEQVHSNVQGDIPAQSFVLSAQEASKALVTEEGIAKVIYTLPETIPGQIYSGYVVVKNTKNIANGFFYQNTTKLEKGPKVVKGIPAITLKVANIGKDRIRISWDVNAWLILGNKFEKVAIYGRGVSESIFSNKIEIPNNGTVAVTSAILEEPKENTYYYADFTIRDAQNKAYKITSKIVLYKPFSIKEKPLKPEIPKPYNPNIPLRGDNDISADKKDKADYLVTEDIGRPITDPKFLESTFHANVNKGNGIQLVWDVPTLKKDGKEIIDYDMQYDIWVTDDKNQLDTDISPIYEGVNIKANDEMHTIFTWEDKVPVGFKWQLTEYFDRLGKKQSIKANKTYYMKIVAKRPYGEDFAISEANIVNITLDKDGQIFVPPVLGKPPLKLHDITTKTATIKWREQWYEILAKNLKDYEAEGIDKDEKVLAEMGSARVYTKESPTTTGAAIRYKAQEGFKEHILLQQENVNNVKGIVKEAYQNYYDRFIELGNDVSYELKVLPYNEVLTQLEQDQGIEQWIVKNESGNQNGWAGIMPTTKKDELSLDWKFHTLEGLAANTKYVVMIRAYREVDGVKQVQTFPSYIICTTLTDYEGPEPTPTVPELHLDGKTDTSIAVWFKYNKDFAYEVVYGRLDDPGKAKVWDFEISDDPTKSTYVPNGGKAIANITGLFPETTYNVWIRAKQKKGKLESAWSNPVRAKTDAIKPPAPPTGLGPAAYQSILEAGKDFKPVGSDYITVEWIKNPNDIKSEKEGKIEKSYEYELEFADNVEFLDSITVNVKDAGVGQTKDNIDILAKNLVRFNQLIANRPYYVRAKTKFILVDTETKREIIKESEYTKWVRILTKKSNDEYDGGDNENIVIYPEQIEESFNNNIWTLEALDTQSIISEIVKKQDYFYTIDMRLYKNKYDAATRRIKLPKPIIDALIAKKMELKVVTNIGSYQIPASTIAYYTNKGSAKDSVQFDFKTVLAYDMKEFIKAYPYTIQKAESLTVSLRGSTAVVTPLSKADGFIRVEQKLDASQQYLYKNLQGFTYDYSLGSWVKESYSIQTKEDGSYISYATPRIGIYAIYDIENYVSPIYTNPAIDQLLSKYTINGLGTTYQTSSIVHSDQFTQLMLGIAQSRNDIDLTTRPTADLRNKAKAAGLYTSQQRGNLTQEEAISGIVRLYEIRTGYKVKPASVKLNYVNKSYRDNVGKAIALGLIEEINPTAPITYGELCTLIIQVLP